MRRFHLKYFFIFYLSFAAQTGFILPQFSTSTILSSETEVPGSESSVDTNLFSEALSKKNSTQNRLTQKYVRRYFNSSSFSGEHLSKLICENLFKIRVHPDTARTLPLLI